MPNGTLEVKGTIDLPQFWPNGTSDADTTKISVSVGKNAFRFRPSPTKPWKTTKVFFDAEVVGKTRKLAIDKNGKLTIRLQGIDAAELHYRPQPVLKKNDQSANQHQVYLQWNLDYRQHFGETATVALYNLLSNAKKNPLKCTVVSQVDSPDDVFDTYGRMVGEIIVTINGKRVNVNDWLLQNGWAFPTFYTSMTADEITRMTALSEKAKTKRLGIWGGFTRQIGKFDWSLVFRRKGAKVNAAADRGSVILPKLFRRQSTYEVSKRSKMASGSFHDYLAQHRDDLHTASDFLHQGPSAAIVQYLDELVAANKLKVDPADLVFREMPSKLRSLKGGKIAW